MSTSPVTAAPSAPSVAGRNAPAVAADRLAVALLVATLGGIYLVGAATTVAAGPGLALVQLVIGLAELAWAGTMLLGGRSSAVWRGAGLAQLVLVGLWLASRTVGLGGPPLPVRALDAICALDSVVIGVLVWRDAAGHADRRRSSMLRCQAAAMLAGMTLFTLGAAHAHGASVHGGFFGGLPGGHFFCRPL